MARFLKIYWVLCVVMTLSMIPLQARGQPELAAYSADHDRLFWFLHVTDIHIGAGSAAEENLELLVNEGQEVFRPWFYLVTGDLVEDGRLEEWLLYRQIVTSAGLGPDRWLDIPGNHDNNLDGDDFEPGFLDYYLTYSITGAEYGQVHNNWVLDTDFGQYQVLGVYTDGDADRLITQEELDFAQAAIEGQPEARLVFVGGHHPLEGQEAAEEIGSRALQMLMGEHHASLYLFGHVHRAIELLWPHEFTEHGYLSWLSPTAGKPEPVITPAGFSILAVDGDSLAARMVYFRSSPWARDELPLPLVLVTAPADAALGGDNPYAYPVSTSSTDNPVRALVFSDEVLDEVRFRLVNGTWQPMQLVEDPLWAATFDGTTADFSEEPWLEVEARVGSRIDTHRIAIRVTDQAACQDGEDNDGDGATDFPEDPGCTGGFDTDEDEPHGVSPYDPGEPDGGTFPDGTSPDATDGGEEEAQVDAGEDGGLDDGFADDGELLEDGDGEDGGATEEATDASDAPAGDAPASGDGCSCGRATTGPAHGWLAIVLVALVRFRRRGSATALSSEK